MNKIDLDINNYQLVDILSLFGIPMNFVENDLKNAKKIVLKTHPDKSGLDPDYFRFYSKAYKILFNMWEFRKKGDINKSLNSENTEYMQCDTEEDKKKLLDNFFINNKEFKKPTNFNKWFNDQFNKNKLYDENTEKGYENWFRNDKDYEDDNVIKGNVGMMQSEFEKRKVKARNLSFVVSKEIEEVWDKKSIGGSELSRDAPSSFDSGLFSNLGYQDLHKAYTETVIPITNEDYEKRDKFKNIDEYMRFRGNQDTKPLSEQQSLLYLSNRERNSDEMATKRSYDLVKQSEEALNKNNTFWAGLQSITNK